MKKISPIQAFELLENVSWRPFDKEDRMAFLEAGEEAMISKDGWEHEEAHGGYTWVRSVIDGILFIEAYGVDGNDEMALVVSVKLEVE